MIFPSLVLFSMVHLHSLQVMKGATERLLQSHPKILIHWDQGAIISVAGEPMSSGATPVESLDTWRRDFESIFTGSRLELVSHSDYESEDKRFRFIHLAQKIGAYDVLEGRLTAIVRQGVFDGRENPVVFVSARLATLAPEELTPRLSSGQVERQLKNLRMASLLKAFEKGAAPDGLLAKSIDPQLLVSQYFDDCLDKGLLVYRADREAAALAYRIVVKRDEPQTAWEIFLNAKDGTLLKVRTLIHSAEAYGSIQARVSPGRLPNIPSNPSAFRPLSNLTITASTGDQVQSDVNGFYRLEIPDDGPSSLDFDLKSPYAHIIPVQGILEKRRLQLPPYGERPANFDSIDDWNISQTNAFYHVNSLRRYIQGFIPQFQELNYAIPTHVNLNFACNATFNSEDISINFYSRSSTCVNTAYSSVIAHEYGHFLVNRRGLAQGSFGEGFSDTLSMMYLGSRLIGENFYLDGRHVRDPLGANIQYPCNVGAHHCGQVLGGLWWRLYQDYEQNDGAMGLARVRQFHLDWFLATSGGFTTNAAHPTTIFEILTIDDDDASLSNGTPNILSICRAASAHSLPCPVPNQFDLHYLEEPEFVRPHSEVAIRFRVELHDPDRQIASVRAYSPQAYGGWTGVELGDPDAEGIYTASFLAPACTYNLSYYFEIVDDRGLVSRYPQWAPLETKSYPAAAHVSLIAEENFQTSADWWAGSPSSGSGPWIWTTISGDPRDPSADADGNGRLWSTGDQGGLLVGSSTLYSRNYVCPSAGALEIQASEYFRSTPSSANSYSVSAQFGTNTIGVGGFPNAVFSNWNQSRRVIRNPPGRDVQLRYYAYSFSGAEFALDAFRLRALHCTRACPGDFNWDGRLTPQDIYDYLSAWFLRSSSADLNHSGNVTTDDLFSFLQGWLAGGCIP